MNLNKMKKEQRKKEKEECKKRILELFEEGLSRREVCVRVSIRMHTLDFWMRQDQMFGHHCIRAQARAEEDQDNAVPPKTGK